MTFADRFARLPTAGKLLLLVVILIVAGAVFWIVFRKPDSRIGGVKDEALAAGRKWRFAVPADLAGGSPKERTYLTTLTFSTGLPTPGIHADGEWVELLRGEIRPLPWLDEAAAPALADGSTRDGDSALLVGSLELARPLAGTPIL